MRALITLLQDEEQAVYPNQPAGGDIAEQYLDRMFQLVAEHDGRIWVADVGGRVVGYATVVARIPRSEPDDGDASHAAITDIVLYPEHRGQGLGAKLMRIAEEHASAAGAPSIRIAHHGRNVDAHRFYRREGYEPLMVLVEKRLR